VAESTFSDVIKRQSPVTLLGAGALVLVVGLVAGFGIGYKVEQSRTRDDVKKARENAAAKAAGKDKPAAATTVRLVGKVGATSDESVTITVDGKTTRRLTVSTGTLFVKTVPGSAADIKKGSRVVWKPKSGSLTTAEEIIVLPAQRSRLGVLITDVASGSLTFKGNGGKAVKVTTTGAPVEKVTTAQKSDVATGTTVMAQTRQSKNGVLSATQIIVLPNGTKFV
jgi:hypothetical protein